MSKHQVMCLKYIQQNNEDSEFCVTVFYIISIPGKIRQLLLDHVFSLKHYGGNETLKKNAAVPGSHPGVSSKESPWTGTFTKRGLLAHSILMTILGMLVTTCCTNKKIHA